MLDRIFSGFRALDMLTLWVRFLVAVFLFAQPCPIYVQEAELRYLVLLSAVVEEEDLPTPSTASPDCSPVMSPALVSDRGLSQASLVCHTDAPPIQAK